MWSLEEPARSAVWTSRHPTVQEDPIQVGLEKKLGDSSKVTRNMRWPLRFCFSSVYSTLISKGWDFLKKRKHGFMGNTRAGKKRDWQLYYREVLRSPAILLTLRDPASNLFPGRGGNMQGRLADLNKSYTALLRSRKNQNELYRCVCLYEVIFLFQLVSLGALHIYSLCESRCYDETWCFQILKWRRNTSWKKIVLHNGNHAM